MRDGQTRDTQSAGLAEPLWLGVHVLSEFTFCPRAGLITLGQERDDRGDDYWLRPNLDHKPSYELYELRREILSAALISAGLGAALVAVFAGDAWLLAREDMVPLAAGVLLLVALAITLSRGLGRLEALIGEWRRIRSLAPAEPDPTVDIPQPVVWWELLRAGFDPVRLPGPVHSGRSRMSGHPWRVLRKGSLQIPVFRVEGDHPGSFYPKHALRAAAYCRLLEEATGAQSPYAIGLFAGTYNGWTFPQTPQSRSFVDQILVSARTFLTPDVSIGPPSSTSVCTGCPHGLPRVYRRGESETRLFDGFVRPRGSNTRDGLVYHSTCGDQFGWTPPHAEARKLGLRVDETSAGPA